MYAKARIQNKPVVPLVRYVKMHEAIEYLVVHMYAKARIQNKPAVPLVRYVKIPVEATLKQKWLKKHIANVVC